MTKPPVPVGELLRQGFRRAVLGRALLLAALAGVASAAGPQEVPAAAGNGGTVTWQPLTLDFEGPLSSETGLPNPFLDYRLDVTFMHAESETVSVVPGYFAADGQAAETGASAGTLWRVRFTPEQPGPWSWRVSFRSGPGVAVADDPLAGQPTAFHGAQGSFVASPADPAAPGLLGKGRIVATGDTYWRHAGTHEPFLKLGANSPENLLAYIDFDQTPGSHAYAAHLGDWQPGDPAWHGGQSGRALVGALNYLAASGMNAAYMLTFNVGGDGDDVWPFTAREERLRYDCSKLDQWGLVFDHMDRLGLVAHLVLQETENDNEPGLALDDGELGDERRLYHRELVARFGHMLGLVWNLGEENQNTSAQQLAFATHLAALDGDRHPRVLHTYPGVAQTVYAPLLAAGALEGASLQVAAPAAVHQTVLAVRQQALSAGRPWAVALDEVGPPNDGVVPDTTDRAHQVMRRDVLWGALMAGAAGVEWYFGYAHPHSDLTCEDWRSRAEMWRQTDVAGQLFRRHVPFTDLAPSDALVSGAPGWALSAPGSFYTVYLPQGGEAVLDLGDKQATYMLRWYDPRAGGNLQQGQLTQLKGPGMVSLGEPPHTPGEDWVALVSLMNTGPKIVLVGMGPAAFAPTGSTTLSIEVQDPDGPDDVVDVELGLVSASGALLGGLTAEPVSTSLWQATLGPTAPLAEDLWSLVVSITDSAGQTAVGLWPLAAD